MKRKSNLSRNLTVAVVVVVIVAVLAVAAYIAMRQYHNYKTSQYNPQATTHGQTINQQGGIRDNTSPAPSVSPSPVVTPGNVNSVITVTSPTAGSKLANGTSIAGSDPGHSTVHYRIIDNSAGELTSGQLNVSAAGQFSGTLENLNPYGKTGYIEFYNVDPQTLKESANIKVSVTF